MVEMNENGGIPPSDLSPEQAEVGHAPEAAGQCRVLVIEDSAVDYKIVESHLKQAKGIDFHIVHAKRLADGLERLAQEDIDILLLDLMLPDSQGLETVRTVRTESPSVPIVVLTAAED